MTDAGMIGAETTWAEFRATVDKQLEAMGVGEDDVINYIDISGDTEVNVTRDDLMGISIS